MSALGTVDIAVQDNRYVDGARTTSTGSKAMSISEALSYFADLVVNRYHPGFKTRWWLRRGLSRSRYVSRMERAP